MMAVCSLTSLLNMKPVELWGSCELGTQSVQVYNNMVVYMCGVFFLLACKFFKHLK